MEHRQVFSPHGCRSVRGLILIPILSLSCAHIRVHEEIREYPASGPGQKFGVGEIKAEHELHGRWLQTGARLIVQIKLESECRELIHQPITQEIRTVRKAGAGLAWDVALALGLSGFASVAFIQPLSFGGTVYATDGSAVQSTRQGYTIGGIFAALGGLMIGATIVDFIRAQDSTKYVEAFRPVLGSEQACRQPRIAWSNQVVTLNVGDFITQGVTDAKGRVSLALPDEKQLKSGIVVGSLGVVPRRAVRIDFRVPYAPGGTLAHTGQANWGKVVLGSKGSALVRD